YDLSGLTVLRKPGKEAICSRPPGAPHRSSRRRQKSRQACSSPEPRSPPHSRPGADAQNQGVQHLAAPSYRVRQTLNGAKLRHTFVPAGSTKRRSGPLANPDDITVPGHDIYTAFQNGIGPQGQASTDGSTYSTVVEITVAGRVIRQWDIKC